ncbi:hypothetical protein HHL17_22475 [Chitinophaga sp. G-6-1-13]|uniref:Alpha-L-rhamnosidase six-hairpin glycosidase domain-containing protein n=1 Tax=Chitinophaga fulva TaxID=2728842 RepID=A0A848GNJ2_9BACT|nr:hypothetical protein [Chitinophaga fulva]NML39984.1 hypothetical protein [Chitinophaga fulva]
MSIKYRILVTTLLLSTHILQAQQQVANALLNQLHGSLRYNVCQYDGTTLLSEQTFQQERLQTGSGDWRLQLRTTALPGGATDVQMVCQLERGTAIQSAVTVSLDFARWSAGNYVLVPAAVYNGNRYRSIGNGYNPDYPRDMYYHPGVPLTISNNPRLSAVDGQASVIALQTGNAATPAVCFFSPQEKKGFVLLTTQQTSLGNSGLTITENGAKDSCSLSISVPAIRKLATGFGDFHPSGDRAPDWKAGDEVTVHFRMYAFDAENIPALLQRFMELRKELSGPNQPRNILPMSKLLQCATDICRGNFIEVKTGAYYRPENNDDFQLGWVSGMINTYPMLALNDEKERKRVARELDFVTEKLQGESGYFYGGITAEGKLRPEKMHPDFPELQAMVRKNGDVLFWLMKHLLLLNEQGYGKMIRPQWEQAAKRLATAFAATWQKHGEFGQYIAPRTGEIAVYNSTAGAIVPAGMMLASRYFHVVAWTKMAENASAFYYLRDVEKQGLTGGDCGDISQDANSESAFGFLESLMAMYYHSGDRRWLQKAETQAALCATWALSYDPVFPPGSAIGKLQSHMAGAIWASIQNKHAAPGICTSSGDALFKLFRATGNRRYADLLRDIQHAHAEAVNMPGHPTTNNLVGSSMERIQPSDAEGKGSIGNFINTRNSWTETAGMLMALEVPGIYVNTDKKDIYVFDHVTAKVVTAEKSAMVITVTNPTMYNASVSLLAENDRQAAVPLSYTAFVKWPHVTVNAGQTVTVRITREGVVAI